MEITIEQKIDNVMTWTKNMNSLNEIGYLKDWIDHYCFINVNTQIEWYKLTGFVPTPHYGGYWMTYENWRELKKKIYNNK